MTGTPVRLVLTHHAGGSRLAYRGWDRHLPADWEVLALDAPGRGLAHRQPLLDRVEDIADALLDRAVDGLDRPLALFGHSMGAAVAARMAGRLRAGAGPAPVWLGLSGWTARPGRGRAAADAMTDDEVLDLVDSLGGTSRDLLRDPLSRRMLLPALRADLTATARFDPMADPGWLDVPLSVFGGRDDPAVSQARLAALGAAAKRLVGVHVHPGGHFYLAERPAELAGQITDDIGRALRRTELSTRGT
ncbi:surfactin synthase thioesterase subunit [Actinokineospora baliensis]|uniref:thioesterase II family protein n=1 Tax=Actinokineospora baliensis TaxID=547056 RepID=UPI001958B3E9|nr:alpha/beta fold hydrolase [Actinokineospora baliensis]MBM7774864.1 surfactin synthase thioesterase subunit [Actinokineospora baliensis]